MKTTAIQRNPTVTDKGRCGMKARLILVFGLPMALLLAIVGLTGAQGGAAPLGPLGTGFTYQGRLTAGGNPVPGPCDFRFGLWNAPSSGAQLGVTQTINSVSLSEGFFTVVVNEGGQFGAGPFDGLARWLAIEVQCSGDGAYTALSPRQELTPVPYALSLPGLRTEQNILSPNIIGGYWGNSVAGGVVGATISGGGVSGFANGVTDDYGTVAGGRRNRAGDDAGTPQDRRFATVGGGHGNIASGEYATVGGGALNIASGTSATVGGGYSNTVSTTDATVGGGVGNRASNSSATVGGGHNNTASGLYTTVSGGRGNEATQNDATVGGGQDNSASGSYASVGGGYDNNATWLYSTVSGGRGNQATSDDATVGGGYYNTASGWSATVPGGADNVAAGRWSFAAGRQAKANNNGCFVWGDSTAADISCTTDNLWVARASGGVIFYSDADMVAHVYLPPGGTSWTNISDRAIKENFRSVDTQAILDTLAAMPVQEYNLKSQDPAIRHVGPVAQDFAVFGYGESDLAINMQDADGVALAAIQGLYKISQEQGALIEALQAENAAQQQQIAGLEARLAALEGSCGAAPAPRSGLPAGWLLLGGLGLVAAVVVQRRLPGGGR
jgi:hypothetical protein